MVEEAEGRSAVALTAYQNSDNHVLTAVALALASFFAGVSSKLNARSNRLGAITLAVVIFFGAAVVVALLPKVSLF